MSRATLVMAAREWLGTPYVHQQATKGAGCDCLGLLRGVWTELGGAPNVVVPAYTKDWSEARGTEALFLAAQKHLISLDASERIGDVLLFRMADNAIAKHIGIQSEAGSSPRFVHAYTGHGVVESPLSQPWKRRIVARFAIPGFE